MASRDNQPTWVPYETIKDCSQGICSFYCRQWCYIIFPPPPPLGFHDDPSSGPNLSPLVIAVIGILASACLLAGYYTFISKYCGRFDSHRRRLGRDTPSGGAGGGGDDEGPGGAFRHEESYTPANGGLEESVIKSIGVFTYRRGEGLVDGTDCSVCLGEFKEDESLRLLPKCSHAFHVACIDTWLKSHANCPLCRAHIVSPSPSPLPPPPVEPTSPLEPQSTPPLPEIRQDEDPERGREGEEDHASVRGGGAAVNKNLLIIHSELGGHNGSDTIVELGDEGVQPIRRSFSMDATRLSRVSVAHVLDIDMEADFTAPAAKEDFTDMAEGEWSSKGALGEQHACMAGGRSRALHCVLSPVRMKRSFSSGRFRFPGRQGRGNHGLGILPL